MIKTVVLFRTWPSGNDDEHDLSESLPLYHIPKVISFPLKTKERKHKERKNKETKII